MIIQDSVFLFIVIFTLFKRTLENPQPRFVLNEAENCQCGQYNFAPRIVGGEVTKPNMYPWMVAILKRRKLHCGGSLINDKYVLTAGHCINGFTKGDLNVTLGAHDIGRKGGINVPIKELILHENFTSESLHDREDIGLIKLAKPVRFTRNIRTVCLPLSGGDYSGKKALVTGWGKTVHEGFSGRYLRQAPMTVLSNKECKTRKVVGEYLTDEMLCAYGSDKDACQGDSGGPLIYETDTGNIEQIGIVSWGVGCATPGIPGVYTRISNYVEWIANNTKDAVYCNQLN